MNKAANRGRAIVVAVAVALQFPSLVLLLAVLRFGQNLTDGVFILSGLLVTYNAVMAWLLYRGYGWAKGLTIFVLAMNTAATLAKQIFGDTGSSLRFVVPVVLFAVGIILLLITSSVDEYFDQMTRERRTARRSKEAGV